MTLCGHGSGPEDKDLLWALPRAQVQSKSLCGHGSGPKCKCLLWARTLSTVLWFLTRGPRQANRLYLLWMRFRAQAQLIDKTHSGCIGAPCLCELCFCVRSHACQRLVAVAGIARLCEPCRRQPIGHQCRCRRRPPSAAVRAGSTTSSYLSDSCSKAVSRRSHMSRPTRDGCARSSPGNPPHGGCWAFARLWFRGLAEHQSITARMPDDRLQDLGFEDSPSTSPSPPAKTHKRSRGSSLNGVNGVGVRIVNVPADPPSVPAVAGNAGQAAEAADIIN